MTQGIADMGTTSLLRCPLLQLETRQPESHPLQQAIPKPRCHIPSPRDHKEPQPLGTGLCGVSPRMAVPGCGWVGTTMAAVDVYFDQHAIVAAATAGAGGTSTASAAGCGTERLTCNGYGPGRSRALRHANELGQRQFIMVD
eukprot:CAMPEP_0115322990 /NCGR_PEP_ID=MMETSP0270-20121206/81694_1 /TAXON_ID=71861 /ORGANISM="Scrippsiella trochoidea, Strain CCMP3099" /LENGTH=141 /DNA_ID=CAMNT_0002742987 /DNA_START=281 /DNA_END=708 /DNA_ORIENTATION=+